MSTHRYSPGPAAAEAFTLGIATATTVALAGVWSLFSAGLWTVFDVILAIALGFPVLLIVVSCLLSVWLGYDKDALDVALS
jgi:uncharacterized SAM-binding protein YcdF (DUF218 family)